MNTCAHWTRFYNHPAYRDFNLYDEGLRDVYPEEDEGWCSMTEARSSAIRPRECSTPSPDGRSARQRTSRVPTTRSSGSPSVTPTPTCACSTNTTAIGSRHRRAHPRTDRQHPLRPRPVVVGEHRHPRAACVLGRRRQPRPRPSAAPLLGPEGPRSLRDSIQAEIYLDGLSRRTFALTSCDTLWNPSRAPEGKQVIGVEEFGAPIRLFHKNQWRDIEKRFNQQLIEHWSHYAPNVTPDNVIAMRSYGPPDIFNGHPDMMGGGYSAGSTVAWQGRYRPIPELSGYKMLLDNVYNCPSNLHSGSGIGRGSSVNCWNTIAADLALAVR